jgi:bifunctional DNase/RNase
VWAVDAKVDMGVVSKKPCLCMEETMKWVRAVGVPARLIAFCLVILSAFAAPAAADNDGVTVKEVQVAFVDQRLVVLLIVDERAMAIHVDSTVAASIHSVLSRTPTRRPLSHDLMRLILLELDAKVTRAVITLKDKTYHADLTITVGDKAFIFDSRSSDAIALAILFKAPIVVTQGTWDFASRVWDEPQGETS